MGAEAASRKPSDWEGEKKWWRMTYSEDDEFDKKEELEEFENRERERRGWEWVEKRDRGRGRGKEQEKREKEKSNGEGKGEKDKEEGRWKVELEGEEVELGGVIVELEGEARVELKDEEESGENVNEAENPDKSDNLKILNTPEDASYHPLYQCTSR